MIIKICGIQNKDTLICCEKNNVNFFGMIFYSKSPRNITFKNANILQTFSVNLNINGVGVFVDENINELIDMIKNLNLKFIQLHGSEDDTYIKNLKKTGVKVIKTISINLKNDLDKIMSYKNADYFLFDYKPLKNELPGGNAKSFDWNILKSLKTNKPWFLSGGINESNIKLILDDIKPFGIDLSSGVEKELGIKDNRIINNFIRKIIDA